MVNRFAKDYRWELSHGHPNGHADLSANADVDVNAEDPLDRAARSDLSQCVWREVNALPPPQRETVTQILLGHRPHEIACATGKPVSTIRSQWFYGRRRLRTALLYLND